MPAGRRRKLRPGTTVCETPEHRSPGAGLIRNSNGITSTSIGISAVCGRPFPSVFQPRSSKFIVLLRLHDQSLSFGPMIIIERISFLVSMIILCQDAFVWTAQLCAFVRRRSALSLLGSFVVFLISEQGPRIAFGVFQGRH